MDANEYLPRPPYNPELAPSGLNPFRGMVLFLGGGGISNIGKGKNWSKKLYPVGSARGFRWQFVLDSTVLSRLYTPANHPKQKNM